MRNCAGPEELALKFGNFFQTALMPAIFEGRQQPGVHNAADKFVAEEVGGKAQDVGVVVAAADLGGQLVVADRRANAGELVGYDGHADTGAVNQDATVALARGHGLGGGDGKAG